MMSVVFVEEVVNYLVLAVQIQMHLIITLFTKLMMAAVVSDYGKNVIILKSKIIERFDDLEGGIPPEIRQSCVSKKLP